MTGMILRRPQHIPPPERGRVASCVSGELGGGHFVLDPHPASLRSATLPLAGGGMESC
jgi:hypothetical protein